MDKSPDAFRTIREVADWLGVAAHVLRFWESKFSQVRPVKRAGGRRYYRPGDMELLGGIKVLLHDRGMTVRGVQRLLKDEGVAAISALSPPLDTVTAAPELSEGIGEEAAWQADAAAEPTTEVDGDDGGKLPPDAPEPQTPLPQDDIEDAEVVPPDANAAALVDADVPPSDPEAPPTEIHGPAGSAATGETPTHDGTPSDEQFDAPTQTGAAGPIPPASAPDVGDEKQDAPGDTAETTRAEAAAPSEAEDTTAAPTSLSRGLDTIWHLASDRQAAGDAPTPEVKSAIEALKALRARVAEEIDAKDP